MWILCYTEMEFNIKVNRFFLILLSSLLLSPIKPIMLKSSLDSFEYPINFSTVFFMLINGNIQENNNLYILL